MVMTENVAPPQILTPKSLELRFSAYLVSVKDYQKVKPVIQKLGDNAGYHPRENRLYNASEHLCPKGHSYKLVVSHRSLCEQLAHMCIMKSAAPAAADHVGRASGRQFKRDYFILLQLVAQAGYLMI